MTANIICLSVMLDKIKNYHQFNVRREGRGLHFADKEYALIIGMSSQDGFFIMRQKC